MKTFTGVFNVFIFRLVFGHLFNTVWVMIVIAFDTYNTESTIFTKFTKNEWGELTFEPC